MSFAGLVSSARDQVEYPEGMRCPSNPCYSVRFLIYEVLSSWALFLFLLVLFTYYLLLIMFLNRWRLRPLELMIPKLLWILLGHIFSVDLESQGLSSVIKVHIFATRAWRLCFISIELCTRYPHPTTARSRVKLRCPTKRLSRFWRKW